MCVLCACVWTAIKQAIEDDPNPRHLLHARAQAHASIIATTCSLEREMWVTEGGSGCGVGGVNTLCQLSQPGSQGVISLINMCKLLLFYYSAGALWSFLIFQIPFYLDHKNKCTFSSCILISAVKAEYIKSWTWGPTRTSDSYSLITLESRNPPLLSSVLSPKPFYSGTRRPLRNKTAFSATISPCLWFRKSLSLSLPPTLSLSLSVSLSHFSKNCLSEKKWAVVGAHQVIIWLRSFYNCCSRDFFFCQIIFILSLIQET